MIERMWQRHKRQTLLIVSGLIPILLTLADRGLTVSLTYTFFVIAYFLRRQLSFPWRTRFGFALLALLLSLLVLEGTSWLSNFLVCNPDPALLHPQLLKDMAKAIFFYGGAIAGWYVVSNLYSFNLKEIFLLQGIYGALIEQKGEPLNYALAHPVTGSFVLLLIVAIYASPIATAYLFTNPQPARPRADSTLVRYAITIIAIFVGMLILSWAGDIILDAIKINFNTKPICLYPLY